MGQQSCSGSKLLVPPVVPGLAWPGQRGKYSRVCATGLTRADVEIAGKQSWTAVHYNGRLQGGQGVGGPRKDIPDEWRGRRRRARQRLRPSQAQPAKTSCGTPLLALNQTILATPAPPRRHRSGHGRFARERGGGWGTGVGLRGRRWRGGEWEQMARTRQRSSEGGGWGRRPRVAGWAAEPGATAKTTRCPRTTKSDTPSNKRNARHIA